MADCAHDMWAAVAKPQKGQWSQHVDSQLWAIRSLTSALSHGHEICTAWSVSLSYGLGSLCALAQCCLWGRMVCSGSKEMLLYPYTSATSHKFALLKGVLLFSLWYSFLTFDSCHSVHIRMCVCAYSHVCMHAHALSSQMPVFMFIHEICSLCIVAALKCHTFTCMGTLGEDGE